MLSLAVVALLPIILSITGIVSGFVQNIAILWIFFGAFFLYFSIQMLLCILSFKKIAIYEEYVLIKRNFLKKDIKIKISDIKFTYQGGRYPVNCITLVVNKSFLKRKSFSVYALYVKDMFEIERIIEEKLKERRGI